MADFELHITSTLGLLLGVCLAAGVFADLVHLPKVTAYLLVGLLVGPSLLDWVPQGHVELFEPLLKLAMAVVLFNLGCEFTFTKFRRIAKHCLILSAAEILATFGLVTIGLLIFGCSGSIALLLGCLAVATAPATTILVLKEFRSEGPVTESTGFLVAMNNFACILMFEFGFLAIQVTQGKLGESLGSEVLVVLMNIAGSILLGVVGGLIVSYGCGFLAFKRWLVLLVATATFLLGVNETLKIPYMLTFFVMGVTVANTSDFKSKIVDELDHLSGLLAVLFFAVHGTALDVRAFVAAGTLGAVYVVFRIAGKWLGVYFAARSNKATVGGSPLVGQLSVRSSGRGNCTIDDRGQSRSRTGKAGSGHHFGIGRVLFEIIGPLFIRKSLIETGEVPLAQAIHHATSTPMEQIPQCHRPISRGAWDRGAIECR